jgi:hypothetical protein
MLSTVDALFRESLVILLFWWYDDLDDVSSFENDW